MIKWLCKEYESIFEDGSGNMAVSRGNVHVYLGMNLDYRTRGQVKIKELYYIEEIITAFDKAAPGNNSTKSSTSPVNLSVVDEDFNNIKQIKVAYFQNLVVKTICATRQVRPDTCTSILFLTMRVRESDEDDWKKLVWMMQYLAGMQTLPLILSANGIGILKWWVDAYFAFHPNIRGHSRGGIYMERGFPIAGSTKQNLNSLSSTETEIAGVDDFILAISWTKFP